MMIIIILIATNLAFYKIIISITLSLPKAVILDFTSRNITTLKINEKANEIKICQAL